METFTFMSDTITQLAHHMKLHIDHLASRESAIISINTFIYSGVFSTTIVYVKK